MPVEEYISNWKNTVVDYVAMISIFKIAVEDTPLVSTLLHWCNQRGVIVSMEEYGDYIDKIKISDIY